MKIYSRVKHCALCTLQVTLLALLSACGGEAPQEVHTSFKTMTIQKSDVVIPFRYSAKMEGVSDVIISPQISGQLFKSCVNEGEFVKKGQVLYVIDDRQYRLALADAEANLSSALASERSAQLEYESNKNLFEKKIVSSYMLQTAENALNQAHAVVAQARAAVNHAKVDLSYCTLTSPVDGVVGITDASVGAQVNTDSHLAIISRNDSMEVKFSVSEREFSEIVSETKSGSITEYINQLPDLTFVLSNGKDYEHTGRVKSVSGMLDKSTGTVVCKAKFPNPDGKLVSGMQGTIVLPYKAENMIVVPQSAVVRMLDKSMVYKVGKDSCATSAIVTTFSAGLNKDVVILSGLNPGDEIVTEGANNVNEGQQVIF